MKLPQPEVLPDTKTECAVLAERRRCAAIARKHLALIEGHDPDRRVHKDDADGAHRQGYGNAALNIAIAIEKGWKP